MPQYDIIIIGAGPAGLSNSYELAKAGFSVLVLEKNPEIGIRPIRCGEAFGPASSWPERIPLDNSWIESPIETVVVESPLETRYTLKRANLGWAIDKSKFLKWLSTRAKNAGVQIHTNTYVNNAEYKNKTWHISYILPNGTEDTYTCRFMVGADGVESRSASWMGIRRKRKFNEICTTAQIHLNLDNYSHKDLYFFVGRRFIKNGYAWIFPGINNTHNIGIGTLVNDNNRENMDKLLFHFLKEKKIPFTGKEKIIYGAIPFSYKDEKLTGKQSLVIGDSAAMAYSLSGGGILNALNASIWASDAIKNFLNGNSSDLNEYTKKFRKTLKWNFKKEEWARDLLFSSTDKEIEELFRKTKKGLPKNSGKLSETRAVVNLLVAGLPFLIKKIFKKLIPIFLFAFLIFPQSVNARISNQQISQIQKGLYLGESQHYDSSMIIFDSYIKKYPQEPIGLTFKMSIIGLKMLDYENDSLESVFLDGLNRGIALANSQLSNGTDSAWAFFIKGMALATKSSQLIKKEHYFKGIQTGRKSLKLLKKSSKIDSTIYDSYLYTGLYDYVKKEIKDKFRWILFLSKQNNIKSGIRKLELCRKHSLFSKTAATQALLGVYAREKDFAQAQIVYADIIDKFPNNRPARWTYANYLFEDKRWNNAEKIYKELLPLMINVPQMAYWQILMCKYRIALCNHKMNNVDTCRKYCKEIINSSNTKNEKEYAYINKAKKLLIKIQTKEK